MEWPTCICTIRLTKEHQRKLGWVVKKSVFFPDARGRAQGEQDEVMLPGTSEGQIALELLR